MSTEDNKAILRRGFEEGLNEGKVAVIDELSSPTFLFHDPDWPAIRTLEDYKRWVTETRSAFPDIHFTIDDMIAEGDKVVVSFTWRGTNTGDIVSPMMRIPATGKQVTATGISIVRLADGKCVEDWHLADTLGINQQLGLIPMPEPVG